MPIDRSRWRPIHNTFFSLNHRASRDGDSRSEKYLPSSSLNRQPNAYHPPLEEKSKSLDVHYLQAFRFNPELDELGRCFPIEIKRLDRPKKLA